MIQSIYKLFIDSGDKNYKAEDARPLIMYQDETTNCMEPDKVDVVDIKIIEWKPSKQLEGNIK